MVSRFYESSVWEPGGFPLSFATRNLSGQRVISFSSTGPLPNPQIACVWESGGPETPQQLLTGLHASHELRDEYVEKLVQGFGPAYAIVTRSRAEDPKYAIIWERIPTGARVNPATVLAVGYDQFQAEVNTFWDDRDRAVYLRSVHVVELDSPSPDRQHLFIGTMWPFDGPAFSWTHRRQRDVSVDHNFIDLYDETVALSCAATLWLALPIPGTSDVVALWRDQIFEPWTREPFDRGAKRHRHFHAHVGMSSDGLEAHIERNSAERDLLAVACSGLGTSQVPPRFTGVWIRKGRTVLRRRFQMWGPGNLENAVISPPTVPPTTHTLSTTSTATSSVPRVEVQSAPPRRLRPRGDEPLLGASRRGVQRDLGIDQPGGARATSAANAGALGSVSEQQHQASPNLVRHPFDIFMRAEMLKYGAHMAQIAVLRNDRLAYIRAYTYAEQGYPTATINTRMRCLSVSKVLTSSVLVPQYLRRTPSAPLDGLRDASFAFELGISRDEVEFNAITMMEALLHRSGISDGTVFATGYNGIYEAVTGDPLPTFVEKSLQAGDMRLALKNWPTDLVTLTTGDYSNVVYIALSELTGKVLGQDYDQYTDAIMLSAIPQSVKESLAGTTILLGEGYPASIARKESPYHGQMLNVGLNPYGGGAYVLDPYTGNPRFGSGAGWWALSAFEMAQVLRQLSSGENPNWPTLVEKNIIWDNGITWGGGFQPFTPTGGAATNYHMMHHNGGGTGSGSWCVHFFDGNNSITIYVVFNVDGPNADYLYPERLAAAAQETEDRGLWCPFDLFNLDQLFEGLF